MIEIVAFFVRVAAAVVGRDIDGEVIADVYEVVAQAADGRRWVHFHGFPTVYYNHEASAETGEPIYSNDETAAAEAQRLCDRAEARGTINPEFWAPTFAAYGSDAHDEAALLEAEVSDAVFAGEIGQAEAARVLMGAR